MFLKAVIAFLALPFWVVAVIPTIIINYDPYRGNEVMIGYLPLTVGLWVFFQCIRDFYVIGKGTLAPWSPPEKIVYVGFYRFLRNPMYVGIVLILCGLSFRFGSPLLGVYALFMAILFHVNLIFIEEPRLHKRFGNDWVEFIKKVPRWLPRFSRER